MSKNICPCCNGESEYLDYKGESAFLCVGCEIIYYKKIQEIMKVHNISKEEAFEKIVVKN